MKFLRHVLYAPCMDMVVVQVCGLLVEKFNDHMDAMQCGGGGVDDPYTEVMNLKDALMCTVRCLDAEGAVKEQVRIFFVS